MSAYAQPAALAATAIVSLALGFGAANWFAARSEAEKPIINPTAWQETAPQVQTVSFATQAKPAAAKCSPWEVSDIAMEEVLDEMINRGWRPPNQGEAIAAMGVTTIAATEPDAPMPYRRNWLPLDPNGETISDEPAAQPVAETTSGNPQPAALVQPPAPLPAES